ncbi:similar to Saccharomyces cerevisiae YDR499W LCD1 Essential protein required for the DNA integrity checkpoint pathways [Maudiozyma barnettii]|uniref:Similar to Saccharomyces cerevisiae YDR499W LCD1 Essential protein required for the DNA integrity checkpoint pathways n=1 Tax=Maudiozyma barnettii TaxID=61262 RepID=A0A8H2VI90_9SACH|nr:Lcd1p [Kazachstania barnettii]CAB4255880.1 similar to Saccharomyces cerevisiae YDR499W LCD1 Essential protein required for the DNA integrity checkpoint pathways [Kazachstania barnettii]CAD1784440.1 similar to Saccharomyces cerevisiae YDR499W LCD1 Essential protein required for the DNA integrity checkpoint pathways [Kazachstania barnettii]
MSDDDSLSFGEDFDELLELANKPPKSTQVATASQTQIPISTAGTITSNQSESRTNQNGENILEHQLNEAKGEASVLRDKISRLNNEREQERKLLHDQMKKLSESRTMEEDNLKQTIQRLQDEKRFLTMGAKTAAAAAATASSSTAVSLSVSSSSPVTPTSITSTRIRNTSASLNNRHRAQPGNSVTSSPIVKRRKIGDTLLPPKKNNTNNTVVPLNLNKITTDEVSLLFDAIISHRSVGTDLTTIEILNKLKLENIKSSELKEDFKLWNNESIGKSLFILLSDTKRSLSLDKCIGILQEKIAFLIKSICFNEAESNIAVPFLLEIMYQIITFRPSAVRQYVLKNTFMFLCDLIRVEEHTLMESKLPQDNENEQLQPQIFQFELINNLVIFNSFDLLEMSLRILQSHQISKEDFKSFFDSTLMGLLKSIYKLALPISYKINFRVAINIVETLKTIANIQEGLLPISDTGMGNKDKKSQSLLESSWWNECIFRIYSILEKEIKNIDIDDSTDIKYTLNFSRYHDSFGLIRNIGNDTIGKIIPKLIDPNIIQGTPSVISKDDLQLLSHDDAIDFQFEYWNFLLKNEILDLFDSLLAIYPNDLQIANSDMLSVLTKLLSREQEILLARNIGQDSSNVIHRQEIIEHLVSSIFRVWTQNRRNIETERVKEFENELFMALWRVVATSNGTVVNPKRSNIELNDQAILVDSLYRMTIDDDMNYYEDAFEDIPNYVKDELEAGLQERTSKIMQIKYNDTSLAMARHILEAEVGSSVSMENVDSLYKAMGL